MVTTIVCMILVRLVVRAACYLLSSQNSGKSLNMFLFITYLRIMEPLLSGYLHL